MFTVIEPEGFYTFSDLQLALAVTVTLHLIITSAVTGGTTPPCQVAGAFQLPFAIVMYEVLAAVPSKTPKAEIFAA